MVDFSKKTKEGNKEVTVVEHPLPAVPDPAALKEIFDANFEGITPSFEPIKIPSGGGLAWEIPTEEGDPEVAKELIGAILDHYPARAYWPEDPEESGGGAPPECSSLDAITGTKYGKCSECQFSQWGTGKKERGQACKKMHRVFFLLADHDSIFPFLVSLPPTSAEGKYDGSFSTYTVKLGGRLKKVYDVKTRIKLIKDKNKDGQEFSKAQFFSAGNLTVEEKNLVDSLRASLKSAMRARPIEGDTTSEEKEVAGIVEGKSPDPWDEGPPKKDDDISY